MQNIHCFTFTEHVASHTVLISTQSRAGPLLSVLVLVPHLQPPQHEYFVSAFFIILCLCVRMFCQYVCMCTMFVYGAHGGQKRVFDSLGPEIQMVVSYQVGAEN